MRECAAVIDDADDHFAPVDGRAAMLPVHWKVQIAKRRSHKTRLQRVGETDALDDGGGVQSIGAESLERRAQDGSVTARDLFPQAHARGYASQLVVFCGFVEVRLRDDEATAGKILVHLCVWLDVELDVERQELCSLGSRACVDARPFE